MTCIKIYITNDEDDNIIEVSNMSIYIMFIFTSDIFLHICIIYYPQVCIINKEYKSRLLKNTNNPVIHTGTSVNTKTSIFNNVQFLCHFKTK